jgi:hypothetical protein
MDASKMPDEGQAALALIGVVACAVVFTAAARRMGWHRLAIGAALFLAGRVATMW